MSLLALALHIRLPIGFVIGRAVGTAYFRTVRRRAIRRRAVRRRAVRRRAVRRRAVRRNCALCGRTLLLRILPLW